MHRRTLFASAAAAAAGLLGLSARADTPVRQKVVYHVDDLDKASIALANIHNHVEGTGGPGGADIRLVINGPALRAFQPSNADARFTKRVGELREAHVGFEVCANTMNGMKLTLADLLPGFVVAEKGGVVRIAELQMQGYAYIKP
jgi:uncharacterized protein